MTDFASALDDSERSGIAFLLADLDVALTFMSVADVSTSAETVERNQRNAREAYDTVLHLVTKLTPNATEQSAIDEKMTALKDLLIAAGHTF